MAEPPKLLDRVRNAIRVRHYSPRTEEAYVLWIRRFILYHGKRHPSSMGAEEVNAFLSHLAVDRTVSASTQNQALAALLFLYRDVLQEPLPWIDDIVRAQRPDRLPVVLTVEEVRQVIAAVSSPVARLVVQLLYGSGLRLLEALMLRVKDVDFARGQLTVRDPKWKHDRTTMLPSAVTAELHEQIVQARLVHEDDLRADGAKSGCRTPSPGSFRMPRAMRGGSGSFRRRGGGATLKETKVAIISTRPWFSVR